MISTEKSIPDSVKITTKSGRAVLLLWPVFRDGGRFYAGFLGERFGVLRSLERVPPARSYSSLSGPNWPRTALRPAVRSSFSSVARSAVSFWRLVRAFSALGTRSSLSCLRRSRLVAMAAWVFLFTLTSGATESTSRMAVSSVWTSTGSSFVFMCFVLFVVFVAGDWWCVAAKGGELAEDFRWVGTLIRWADMSSAGGVLSCACGGKTSAGWVD